MTSWNLHFPLPLEQVPLEQNLKPHQPFHFLSIQSTSAAEDEKRAGGSCPISASKLSNYVLIIKINSTSATFRKLQILLMLEWAFSSQQMHAWEKERVENIMNGLYIY